jgi:hypothetical protein
MANEDAPTPVEQAPVEPAPAEQLRFEVAGQIIERPADDLLARELYEKIYQPAINVLQKSEQLREYDTYLQEQAAELNRQRREGGEPARQTPELPPDPYTDPDGYRRYVAEEAARTAQLTVGRETFLAQHPEIRGISSQHQQILVAILQDIVSNGVAPNFEAAYTFYRQTLPPTPGSSSGGTPPQTPPAQAAPAAPAAAPSISEQAAALSPPGSASPPLTTDSLIQQALDLARQDLIAQGHYH